MSQVVCVLGMHRSGTSLVSRLLNLLGVEWGPETLVARPAADNPRGFWEHPDLAAVNEAVLQRFGGRWDAPPAFPAGWAVDPSLDDLRQQAREAIGRLSAGRQWGWKDPRTCLTFPFWRPLLAPAGISCVLCFRNVADVARSLRLRNDLPIEAGADLWLAYVARALEDTSGVRRLLVVYERLMADREAGLARLARFCGLTERLADADISLALTGAFDDALFHHRNSAEDLREDPAVPFQAKAVSLAVAAMDNAALADELSIEHLTSLARQGAASSTEPAALRFRLNGIRSRMAALEVEVAAARSDAASARANLAWSARQLEESESRCATLAAQTAVWEQRLAQDDRERARFESRVTQLEDEIHAITSSTGWRMVSRWRAGVRRLLPPDSRRQRFYLRALRRAGINSTPKS